MATKNNADGRSTNQQGESNGNRQRESAGATGGENVTSRATTVHHVRPEGAIATRTRSQASEANAQQNAPGSTQSSAQSSPRLDGIETPAIAINGTLQNPDQNLRAQGAAASRRPVHHVDGAAMWELPPPLDFDYRRTRRSGRDDDEFSDAGYDRHRRPHSADDRIPYDYDGWAEYVLSTPEMTRYLQRRRRLGLPAIPAQPDVPFSHIHSHDYYAPNLHVALPPTSAPHVVRTDVERSVVAGAMLRQGQRASSAQSAADSVPRQEQAATTRSVTITAPAGTREVQHSAEQPFRFGEVRRQTADAVTNPLDTSTPKAAAPHQASTAKKPTPTNVSKKTSRRRSNARSDARSEVVYVIGDTTRDDSRDATLMSTSTTSDVDNSRYERRHSKVRTPTFNGKHFHIFKEMFLATARDAGWSEEEKDKQLRYALRGDAKLVLGQLGSSENWTCAKIFPMLEEVHAGTKSYVTVQAEMNGMKRKPDQTIHEFATQVREAARPARVSAEERDYLVRSVFTLGLSDYPDMVTFIDRESKSVRESQEAIDLAVRYERDYMVSSTSRVAQEKASAAQVNATDETNAEVNWMYRNRDRRDFNQPPPLKKLEEQLELLTKQMAEVMKKHNIQAPEVTPKTYESKKYNNQKWKYDKNYRGKNWKNYNKRDDRKNYQGRQQYTVQQPCYYVPQGQPQVMQTMPTQQPNAAPQVQATTVVPQMPGTTQHNQQPMAIPVQHVTFQQPPQVLITPADNDDDDHESMTSSEQSDE